MSSFTAQELLNQWRNDLAHAREDGEPEKTVFTVRFDEFEMAVEIIERAVNGALLRQLQETDQLAGDLQLYGNAYLDTHGRRVDPKQVCVDREGNAYTFRDRLKDREPVYFVLSAMKR